MGPMAIDTVALGGSVKHLATRIHRVFMTLQADCSLVLSEKARISRLMTLVTGSALACCFVGERPTEILCEVTVAGGTQLDLVTHQEGAVVRGVGRMAK